MGKELPKWIQQGINNVDAAQAFIKRRGGRGKSIGHAAVTGEMGGTGDVVELVRVKGQAVNIEISPGVFITLAAHSRVVQTADGRIEVISGGENGQITVREASKIFDSEVSAQIKNALSRDRNARKKILPKKP